MKHHAQQSTKTFQSIYDYLDSCDIAYESITHERTNTLEQAAHVCQIPSETLLRTVVLEEESGLILAILPINRLLDFAELCKVLNRDMEPARQEVTKQLFIQCEPHSYPPLPDLYAVDAILDSAIMELEYVYFEPGKHDELIKMSRDDFMKLQQHCWQGDFSALISDLSEGDDSPEGVKKQVDQFTPQRFKNRLQEDIELPAIPSIAADILKLRTNLNATASDLAEIVVHDPSLSAQIVKWAQSPYYGYAGKITSIECAIIKVLGFDLVLNLCIGIALNKAMKTPVDGPLGLKAYWKFAISTALLAENLVKNMPPTERPILGLVYLSGLLHNFGHLLLAELFPPQYFILNRYIEVNPHICLTQIEKHVLGVNHTQIGAWLLTTWNLPEEVLTAVSGHHQEDYASQHRHYSNLVYVATRLLKKHDLGDANDSFIPAAIYESLGFTPEMAEQALEEIMAKESDIQIMVDQLT